MSGLRCAIYARYSSDKQSPASIQDQCRKCAEDGEKRRWQILTEHIYTDAATSGTVSDRPGLTKLLRAAESIPRPFDVILIDDTSRLSRKVSDVIAFSDRIKFAGVLLVFCSQGFDSDSEQSEMLLSMHGMMDSAYIRELGKKTFRGCEGRVLSSMHAGGRIFGYRSVPVEDPQRRDSYGRPLIAGARLAVNPEEAAVVERIFRLYAGGLSIKSCAKKLNGDGVRSPQPRHGRQQSWAPSSVRNILRNERYIGVVTWGRTRKVRNPQNGRRINRKKDESEWLRIPVPDQRIVSQELWDAVHSRRTYINSVFGDRGRKGGLTRGRAASSPYIFSGLLRCGVCAGAFVIVSGAGKNHRMSHYGCNMRDSRGPTVCTNDRRVRCDLLEAELLETLQQNVLSDSKVNYTLQRLEGEVEKRLAGLGGDMDRIRHRKSQLEAELKNLTRAIADGLDSPTLRTGITERENEIALLTAKVLGGQKESVRSQVRNLRKFVKDSLGDIRELIAGHANPAVTRMHLAKHIDQIDILPDEGKAIKYKGKWDLLGGRDGAGGES